MQIWNKLSKHLSRQLALARKAQRARGNRNSPRCFEGTFTKEKERERGRHVACWLSKLLCFLANIRIVQVGQPLREGLRSFQSRLNGFGCAQSSLLSRQLIRFIIIAAGFVLSLFGDGFRNWDGICEVYCKGIENQCLTKRGLHYFCFKYRNK